jgi:F-type H+-transporting ATPase subunit b
MAENAKKKSKGRIALIVLAAVVVYSIIWYMLRSLEIWLSDSPGDMVGFAANLPLQMFNFLILLYLLNRLLYKPVLDFMEERNSRIQRQIMDAEEDRAEARKLREETKAELQRIQKESTKMLREAQEEARKERDRIIERANEERSEMLESAQRDITLQIEQAKSELRGQLADYAVDIARQVIGEGLAPDNLHQLAENSLAQIESGASSSNN